MYTYQSENVDRKVCNLKNSVSFDRNLLKAARADDQNAYAELVRFFDPIIRMICSSYFLVGGDNEDLVQEGRIGLYNAVRSFDESKNDNFVKYAKICIHRAILTAIKTDARLKNTLLNTSVSLDERIEISEESAEEMFLTRERLLEVYERIEDNLTDMERKVLDLFVDGYAYREIGDLIGKNSKSVDNALSRIRGKLQ